MDKTRTVIERRLTPRLAVIKQECRCEHTIDDLKAVLAERLADQPDWILIVGASAISDRADVIPMAIASAGGTIDRYGIPVDPGNLLLLAHVGKTNIVGLPGCARSPRYNGFDMIIDRLACELDLSDAWLNGLSVGGLLTEIADRPEPRTEAAADQPIGAILLAAGSSQRAGSINKLLVPVSGTPMVSHVASNILRSDVDRLLAVTGFEHQRVELALQACNCDCHYNPGHMSGMASSVVAGVSQLIESGAVLVCLADMPHVKPETINALIDAYRKNPQKYIFVPIYEGQRGNPMLFAQPVFDALLSLEGDMGARLLVKGHPDHVVEVSVADAGILKDYDTADELNLLTNDADRLT